MGYIRLDQHVAAPIEMVFDHARRADRLPAWNPFFVRVADGGSPVQHAGEQFAVEMRILGRRLTADSRSTGSNRTGSFRCER